MTAETELLIIGAGPAGMAAAATAARHGVDTVLLDEQEAPGGQIYRGIESVARQRPADLAILGPDYAHGAGLCRELRGSGADYRPASQVWQIGPADRRGRRTVWFSRDGSAAALRARHLLLATGAMERPVPIPGWTLPGVMSAGAAQIALKTAGLYPETGLLLAGSGPLLWQLAAQYAVARVPVAAIIDTTPPGAVSRAARFLPLAALGGQYLLKGWQMMRTVRRAGIPVWRGAGTLRVLGEDRARGLAFTVNGAEVTLPGELVALHEGVIPNTQLTRLAGLAHRWDPAQRCFRPVTDGWGESETASTFVAGDGAGILGAAAAEQGGRLSALAIAHRLGRIGESERDLAAEQARWRRLADRAVRPFLDAWFPPPAWIGQTPDESVICRCEEVTAGQLRAVVALGCPGPNQAKAFLRCGMGPCQGRMCGPTVTEVMAAASGRPPEAVGAWRVRPPARPVSVAELAALAGPDSDAHMR